MKKEKAQSGSGCVKWGVGCGFVILVTLLILVLGGYLVWKFSSGALSGLGYVGDLVVLDDQIVNETPYEPPSDGLLSLEQVESLVYIQTRTKEAIGPEFEESVEEFHEFIGEILEAEDMERFRKLLSVPKKMTVPLKTAKEAQIEAINTRGLSREEYQWIRRQAKYAFGIDIPQLDVKRLLEKQKESVYSKSEANPINTQNRVLLEPHEQLLRETLPLSLLGL